MLLAISVAAALMVSVAAAVVIMSSGDDREVNVQCRRDRSDVASTTSSAALNTPAVATVIVHVRPVDANGCLIDSFRVKRTASNAYCGYSEKFGPSSEKLRSALRCSTARPNVLWDPCWPEVGASRQSVVCMSSPWTEEVSRLFMASGEELPTSLSALDFGFPWGIELADGQRCRVLTGAHSSISAEGLAGPDADVIDYSCDDPDIVLLRGIDKSAPIWQVNAAQYVDGDYLGPAERLGPQPIVTAWY